MTTPSKGHSPGWNPFCSVVGCDRQRSSARTRMCRFHHYRKLRYGNPLAEGIFKTTTGGSAEQIITQVLQSYGRKVLNLPFHSPADLMVDDAHRVEVKSGKLRELHRGKYSYLGWTFNIHRHGILDEQQRDFYILRLEDVPHGEHAIYMLLKAPIGSMTLTVSMRGLLNQEYARAIGDFYAFAKGEYGNNRGVALRCASLIADL